MASSMPSENSSQPVANDHGEISRELSSNDPSPQQPSSASLDLTAHPTDEDTTPTDQPEAADDEATTLAHLSATVRDQDDLAKAVGQQADQALLQQANERDQQRLERAERDKAKLERELQSLQQKLQTHPHMSQRLHVDIDLVCTKIEAAVKDCAQINKRIKDRNEKASDAVQEADSGGAERRAGETQRDFLIRTGKITPFARMRETKDVPEKLSDVLGLAEQGESDEEDEQMVEDAGANEVNHLSHRNLARPGFKKETRATSPSGTVPADKHVSKKRKVQGSQLAAKANASDESSGENDFHPDADDSESSGPGFIGEGPDGQPSKSRRRSRRRQSHPAGEAKENLADIDDGNEKVYQARLQDWEQQRRLAREQARGENGSPEAVRSPDQQDDDGNQVEMQQNREHLMPHPTVADQALAGGLLIPGDVYPSLFGYQKTGVRWLWELYEQRVGGIIGDEMGLGKTIQVISFLAALHHSGKYTKPIIVVCPATIMKQWVSEFHRWWPPFRVSILHSSGSGMLDVRKESELDDDLDNGDFDGTSRKTKALHRTAKGIVNRVSAEGHVLVTTYSGLQTYAEELLSTQWGYAVLDEGHKIRNPNSAMTIYCKGLRTSNRIILSGTPMQNNLTELWSLFDFVFPMRLGTLVSFRDTFEIPIKHGGYAKASNLEVETAFNCAEALKDTISPYLLQRWKSDVASDLPNKSEQVLFCKLTKEQRSAYEGYLKSPDHIAVEEGRRQPLFSIDMLRKICNHPDLPFHKQRSSKGKAGYGAGNRSGKMQVVKALLRLWKDTGHKTLLFAQHRIMLDILEKFVGGLDGINYRRMDGNTPIQERQHMVDEFNNDDEIHLFLLTTKVGGLGVNLIGADRVIIYDPDWNPSTDVQARERAWRLGQKREVMIFRLMTAGTIEEKIYHRQLFKQFLTNKILRDPKQRQTFHLHGLQDLFTLGDADLDQTETGGLFAGSERRIAKSEAEGHADGGDAQLTSIAGVDHAEQVEEMKPEKSSGPVDNKEEQNHFMESLLGSAGVHASLSHDAILDQSAQKRKVTADPAMITREAKRVAAEAAARLRLHEAAARNTPIGTPTWTGEVGVTGRPEEPRPRGGIGGGRGGLGRGGPSSSSVLTNLASRQPGQTAGRGGGQRGNHPRPEQRTGGVDFMPLIRDYMKVHGGRVYTQMLVDHFNQYCTTAQRSADFREMLRTIATLEQSGMGRGGLGGRRGLFVTESRQTGRGRWTLKEEFGGPSNQ